MREVHQTLSPTQKQQLPKCGKGLMGGYPLPILPCCNNQTLLRHHPLPPASCKLPSPDMLLIPFSSCLFLLTLFIHSCLHQHVPPPPPLTAASLMNSPHAGGDLSLNIMMLCMGTPPVFFPVLLYVNVHLDFPFPVLWSVRMQ
jgi:hypothetical protein